MDAGRLPNVPVHLDSPMASDVTQLYRRYAEREGLEMERRELYGNWLTLHRTVDESMRLNSLKGPRIIIASSGMMTGGRVLHHLRRLLPDRNNLVVLAGYQAMVATFQYARASSRLKGYQPTLTPTTSFVGSGQRRSHPARSSWSTGSRPPPRRSARAFTTKEGMPSSRSSTAAMSFRSQGPGRKTTGPSVAFDTPGPLVRHRISS
jgi:hypothetical protein